MLLAETAVQLRRAFGRRAGEDLELEALLLGLREVLADPGDEIVDLLLIIGEGEVQIALSYPEMHLKGVPLRKSGRLREGRERSPE